MSNLSKKIVVSLLIAVAITHLQPIYAEELAPASQKPCLVWVSDTLIIDAQQITSIKLTESTNSMAIFLKAEVPVTIKSKNLKKEAQILLDRITSKLRKCQ